MSFRSVLGVCVLYSRGGLWNTWTGKYCCPCVNINLVTQNESLSLILIPGTLDRPSQHKEGLQSLLLIQVKYILIQVEY